jgi:hypothetical protein
MRDPDEGSSEAGVIETGALRQRIAGAFTQVLDEAVQAVQVLGDPAGLCVRVGGNRSSPCGPIRRRCPHHRRRQRPRRRARHRPVASVPQCVPRGRDRVACPYRGPRTGHRRGPTATRCFLGHQYAVAMLSTQEGNGVVPDGDPVAVDERGVYPRRPFTPRESWWTLVMGSVSQAWRTVRSAGGRVRQS